jgi:hypothetical protein
MSSFSCSHLDMELEYCMKLRADCVPGRPGCVLRHNSEFAMPWEQRLRERFLSTEPRVGPEHTGLDPGGG